MRTLTGKVAVVTGADAIHHAIVEDKLFVMTHAGVLGVVEERFAAILGAF